MDEQAGEAGEAGIVAVGRLAALLAATGESGLADGLALVVEGLGLRSAVLRDVSGDGAGPVRAVAGDVVRAVTPQADSARQGRVREPVGPTVELPVAGGGRTIASLTVVGARPSQLPVLRAAAAVVGLALSLSPSPDGDARPAAAGELLAAAERGRDALADALHDGPVQALVAARYAADAAVRGADPADARAAVQEALVAMRRSLWQLRPRGGDGLTDALRELAERLAEAGRPPLTVQAEPAVDLAGSAGAAAYRFVQHLVGDAAVAVRLREDGAQVIVEAESSEALPPLEEHDLVARSLGGLLATSARQARLALPRGPYPLPPTAAGRPRTVQLQVQVPAPSPAAPRLAPLVPLSHRPEATP